KAPRAADVAARSAADAKPPAKIAGGPGSELRERLGLLWVRHEEIGRRTREPQQPNGRGQHIGASQDVAGHRTPPRPRQRDPRELRIRRRGEGPAELLGIDHYKSGKYRSTSNGVTSVR